MKLKVFQRDGGCVTTELPHLIASLTAWHYDHDRGCVEEGELDLHGFTPAHARALIEMLTPIAAIPTHKLKVHSEGKGEAEDRSYWFECIGYPAATGPMRSTQGEALEDFKAHVAEKAVTA